MCEKKGTDDGVHSVSHWAPVSECTQAFSTLLQSLTMLFRDYVSSALL